jgi:hypothetical protein
LAEFVNDNHDERAVHSTYWEKLCHIKQVLPKYQTKKGHNWNGLAQEFVNLVNICFVHFLLGCKLVQKCGEFKESCHFN